MVDKWLTQDERVERIFKALCPFCNGTAIKSGNRDVYHIGPAYRVERMQHLPSAGRTAIYGAWVHEVQLVGEGSPYEQCCWADKAREAAAPACRKEGEENCPPCFGGQSYPRGWGGVGGRG